MVPMSIRSVGRAGVVLGAAGALALGLAACSSGSGSDAASSASASPSMASPSPTMSPTSSPTSSPTMSPTSSPSDIGGSVLPPVMVEVGQSSVSAKVGETIVFNEPDPAAVTISTDRPDVLELTQGGPQGGAVMNPGAKALAAGTAMVTITPKNGGAPRTVEVTITG